MSLSETDTEPKSIFGENLRDARAELRRGDLRQRLDEQASILRDFILLSEVHEAFVGESVTLDENVRQQITAIREFINNGEFESIESSVDELDELLESEVSNIRESISERRISQNNKLDAMKKLNERVENINPNRISQVRERYADLTGLDFVEGETVSEQRKSVQSEVDDLQREFDAIQKDVFGQFYGKDLEGIVRDLLDDEAFRIKGLTTEQFERLKKSPLSDCLEIVLS